ncbi:unnamed protein product [Macrosiphum euphorbiae]|uniref:Uncharacterized protein n=1 Tax=Macrosiphum euphorbiae TaxID=13131 RepID=A0AAV0WKS6_9HEMI|nr:unnamed protein product [Macrosiphum euphorbiae]
MVELTLFRCQISVRVSDPIPVVKDMFDILCENLPEDHFERDVQNLLKNGGGHPVTQGGRKKASQTEE